MQWESYMSVILMHALNLTCIYICYTPFIVSFVIAIIGFCIKMNINALFQAILFAIDCYILLAGTALARDRLIANGVDGTVENSDVTRTQVIPTHLCTASPYAAHDLDPIVRIH